MYDPANPVWHTVELGPMPVVALARIGIQAEAGTVVFFNRAMKHTFEAYPQRRGICWPWLGAAVCTPTHIGQQPKHVGTGFDLTYVSPAGTIILVSLLLTPIKRDPHKYPVTSAYPVDMDSLERRLRVGTTIAL